MFVQTVRRLLELSPAGLTNDQILWRLKNSGLRLTAEDILQTLTGLADSGEAIMLKSGRWRLAAFERVGTSTVKGGGKANPGSVVAPQVLSAVTAIISKKAPLEPDFGADDDASDATGTAADADWRKLLAYFAATQRLDPRGKVDERVDKHAVSWQLVRADGSWWEPGELHIPVDTLPDTFRVALMKRPEAACSIGYPISLFSSADVPAFVPALLLPATYRFNGHALLIELARPEPVLNPLWFELAVRRSTWQKDALIDALFPEGENQDFPSVVGRLRNSLATIGGTLLKPAQLAGEMTVAGEGLRNAAGLFFPSDDRFSKGTERDLDAMQAWSDDSLRETALWALLRADGTPEKPAPAAADALAPSGPKPLTDRQYDAADSALRGPLTLIQGPPGTGKSEVILALVASIVLAGRSVLIASKNHQALNEVERRMNTIVSDAPLLTRGRDSDGDRDTSFLAQMRVLAAGDVMPDDQGHTAPEATVIGRSRELHGMRQLTKRRTELNLQLSEAAERFIRWKEARPAGDVAVATRIQKLIRFLMKGFRRLRRSSISSPNDPDQLVMLINRLNQDLQKLPAELAADELHGRADVLSKEAASALQRIARRRTTPTKPDALALAERLKEFDFNKTKYPAIRAEDARMVLRYRPVWAISTLSVASRVPLIPALFDYVIFDEASQCDIASALPLLARGRKAVVVGDPMQLGFIPQLSARQEHALMDAAGLGAAGRHSVAQSVNSLFDFVRHRRSAQWHFLADQFRSAADIVDYLNNEFYDGRLVASQDERNACWPNGYAPGLAWHDVQGRATREDGGSVNHAEADAIVQILTEMIRDRQFTGHVGVLSPFNSQVALLMRRIRAVLTESEIAAANLRVSTIDKFQGGEADVILFSLVVAEGTHQATSSFYERERRRLNVAISRARALCLIFGDKSYIRRSGIGLLARLLERTERGPKPRQEFDSEWERRLYAALKRRGLDPFPQYPVGSRYLDFALDPEGRKLDVEVDGRRWHADPDGNRKVSDRLRDRELIARGWKVRRFWVHELAENMETCLDLIERDLGRA